MYQYDAVLKNVLRQLTGRVVRAASGVRVVRWQNAELPAVRSRRADMLGEAADSTLLHIELQSTNQAGMARRMLEYAAAIRRQFGRFPKQVVLYVGSSPLRMAGEIEEGEVRFRCQITDIRHWMPKP
jgi:hypothetical protein